MIVGVGTDIVEIERIAQLYAKQGLRFAQRLLSTQELQEFELVKLPEPFLAKRWALKEAVAKALGTGIAHGVSFKQMTIAHQPSGKPYLLLSGEAQIRAQKIGAQDWQISVSDEKYYSVAYVIAQSIPQS
ncbi:holo-[acyl-carrier-protein] synthase [Thiosulfatimonas sediminis]|uniref:Holo-[acyl-carrier-protein] synthase n=1 Tax=Thiosulfatimonas sediminis TaxID=2675054 RepID=A0A6F8PVH5_9GAMM|nr:holo-ACP synthase [Thiosulfatimonas sediminis]BBP46125.1 holo-[acyl-carrier-protein] synthase [Thiosulfatimonas sediminis]